jgi:hypothetical protein
MLKVIRRHRRSISVAFALVFLVNIFAPVASYAVTGSSSMPEYRSFEPVSTTNMVNPLTGDFTYNIPLMNVPNGYPLNLSYHSNEINPEAQASWVGLGWTLNPGAINRTKRGFPDEYNGASVTYYNKMPKNWTLTMGAGASAEAFGFQGSLLGSLRYNNYKGFGRILSGSIGYEGMINLGFSYEAGRIKFNPSINPMAIAKAVVKSVKEKKSNTDEIEKTPEQKKQEEFSASLEMKRGKKSVIENFHKGLDGGNRTTAFLKSNIINQFKPDFNMSPVAPISISANTPEYKGFTFDMKFELGLNIPPVSVDVSAMGTGSFVYQNYTESVTKPVYGYFNLENRNGGGMADYYSEIENSFEKKDRYLGIPFANYDMFNLSGEAMGGSFRGFRSDFGHFYPESTLSKTTKGNLGVDVALPSIASIPVGITDMVMTGGAGIGGGYGEITTGDWSNYKGNTASLTFKNDAYFKATSNEKIAFRFASDKAGSITRSNDDNIIQAGLDQGDLNSTLNLQGAPSNETSRILRSSYVSMHSDDDFNKTSNGVRYDVSQKQLFIKDASGNWYDYNSSRTGNGLGEIVTYNAEGTRYIYGLPLKTKNEKEVSVSLSKTNYTISNGLIASVSDNGVENSSDFKRGYTSNTPYASQFLLTQITSPDYIDRTMDGLTVDDFGAYTRFNYAKATTDGAWYKYRTPFNGLSYSDGSLSDAKDNMGSFSGGEKELYYIQSVSSKTHIAIFELGNRVDGKGVASIDIVGGGAGTALKRLETIKLYAIADCQEVAGSSGVFTPKAGVQPIQTVHFDYDYSLCNNVPNSTSGKLTLKKIWFEYEGKVKSKIAPYKFQYSYPTPGTYPAKYAALEMPLAAYPAVQNPDYNVLDSDGWGNYRSFGNLKTRIGDLAQFFPFVDQQDYTNGYDPAAWCLKKITLPSGGEIHVQYEQNDYQYVQDKRAMLMVPLDATTDQNEKDFKSKPYYLDLAKAGIDPGSTDLMTIAHQLFKPMTDPQGNNRVYFNFLYTLVGTDSPDPTRLYSDYIEGYARIAGYGVNNGKIYFYFWEKPGFAASPNLKEINLGPGKTKWEMPRKACEEFYKANRQGLISDAPNSMGENDMGTSSLSNLFSKAKQVLGVTKVCFNMKPSMSFVRLQLPDQKAKKGGGIRVKRLLMYDAGIASTSDKVLYGNEYEYTKDGMSSGVVPNEPGGIRRENPLVFPLDRDSQSKFDALLYGDDMYQNEGPLGASLYPAASVSYEHVKITNIHKGKTTNGYEVQEFYTCRQFPFVAQHSSVTKQHDVPLGGGFISGPYERVAPHVTQGYVFIMNDMHGKLKRIAKYPAGSDSPVYEETYEYTKIGEPVRVMDEDKRVTWKVLGKESEVFAERKEVYDFGTGLSTGIDLTLGAWTVPPALPIVIVYPTSVKISAYVSEQILRSHVTSKVVSYSVMPKTTTILSDGVVHITENMVYDKFTGNPVITRSTEDFNKSYTNQTFLASWDYPNYQSKALNERLYVEGQVTTENNSFYLQFNAQTGGCDALNKFVLGDFLGIRPVANDAAIPALFHVCEIDKVLLRLKLSKSALQATSPNTQLSTIVGQTAGVTILQSGRTNQLTTTSGNILAYNRPGIYDYNIPSLNADITSFLSLLNLVQSSGSTDNNLWYGLLPENLKIIDPKTGECISGKAFKENINIKKQNGKTILSVGGSQSGQESEPLLVSYSYTGTPPIGGPFLPEGRQAMMIFPPGGGEAGCYTLTSAFSTSDTPENFSGTPSNQKNAIWSDSLIDLSKCFQLNYRINLGSKNNFGGEGMVFMLQRDSRGTTALGTANAYMGSGGIAPSLGVEFDTYFNGYDSHGPNHIYNDVLFSKKAGQVCSIELCSPESPYVSPTSCYPVDFDHIDIFANTVGNPLPAGARPVAAIPDLSTLYGAKNIEDGLYHDVMIDWNPVTQTIKVFFDNALRKQYTGDIVNDIFGGVNKVRFGWTAATGYCTANTQKVCPGAASIGGCSSSSEPGCVSVLNGTVGTYTYNAETGYIQFNVAGACPQNVNCLILCEGNTPEVLGGIISASAQTFAHEWDYDATKYPILTSSGLFPNMNEYETGARGKWRLKSNYIYRTAIKEGRNYASGEMIDFILFNWKNPEVNNYDKWLLQTSVTQYNPNGAVFEDKNALDVYSTALYGYNNTLPVAVAQNAQANKIFYESFENDYLYNGNKRYLENGFEISAGYVAQLSVDNAHSGSRSFKLTTNTDYILGKVQLTNDVKQTTRLWITSDKNSDKLKGNVYITVNGQMLQMKYVAAAGNWMQFEIVSVNGGTQNTNLVVRINQPTSIEFGNIYMDDFRSQPEGSEMTCYVYDHAQRLIAVFDDRHYALMYQYNAEGLLVRKLKETVKGIKTISETQYNVKGEPTP